MSPHSQFWDTAGQERFMSIGSQFFRSPYHHMCMKYLVESPYSFTLPFTFHAIGTNPLQRNADAIALVYDTNHPQSYDALEMWKDEVRA